MAGQFTAQVAQQHRKILKNKAFKVRSRPTVVCNFPRKKSFFQQGLYLGIAEFQSALQPVRTGPVFTDHRQQPICIVQETLFFGIDQGKVFVKRPVFPAALKALQLLCQLLPSTSLGQPGHLSLYHRPNALYGGVVQHQLLCRHQFKAFTAFNLPLSHHIKISHPVDLVPEELDSYGIRSRRRKNIQNAAPNRILSRAFHHFHPVIAAGFQTLCQLFRSVCFPRKHAFFHIQQPVGGNRILHQCVGGGNHIVAGVFGHLQEHKKPLPFIFVRSCRIVKHQVPIGIDQCFFSVFLQKKTQTIGLFFIGNNQENPLISAPF